MEPGEQEAIEHLINMQKHFMMRNSIQRELTALEDELYTKNRFFPNTNVLAQIDKIASTSFRLIKSGTILYRARTIPRQKEASFQQPIYRVLGDFLGMDEDLDPQLFDEIFLQGIIDDIRVGIRHNDYNDLKQNLQVLKDKGWWGYPMNESGAPPAPLASNSRLSPFGISYLYTAGDKSTAALEVRPLPSQLLSIAEVEITEDVKLFDLTRRTSPSELVDEKTCLLKELLSDYYSRPNYSGSQSYLLTQYLSEYVKNMSNDDCLPCFDGICYNSSLSMSGIDYVLFETGEAKKYRVISSSVEKALDLNGKLKSILPMDDTIILQIVNWPS